jgi:6-phosphofructokinase
MVNYYGMELEKVIYRNWQVAAEREKAGKSLKGKYIVRVGWDDVRGWLGEGGTLIGSSRCPSCKSSL